MVNGHSMSHSTTLLMCPLWSMGQDSANAPLIFLVILCVLKIQCILFITHTVKPVIKTICLMRPCVHYVQYLQSLQGVEMIIYLCNKTRFHYNPSIIIPWVVLTDSFHCILNQNKAPGASPVLIGVVNWLISLAEKSKRVKEWPYSMRALK